MGMTYLKIFLLNMILGIGYSFMYFYGRDRLHMSFITLWFIINVISGIQGCLEVWYGNKKL